MACKKEKREMPLIQVKPAPKGNDKYEKKRKAILEEFASKVPEEYFVPQEIIDNPPRDVTDVPHTCGILTDEELEITENYDAAGLAAAIATRKYTAVAVTTAFLKRSIIAHQLTCCLTQWFPDEAIAQAKSLDDQLECSGKTVGPLHGVPISIKEHIPIAGRPSSAGFISTITNDESDALLVSTLRKLGAVFYVKTNQPQSLMHLESHSFFGRTLNPYNSDLSSGGSTGGEGALIALRGSILGVGSDYGGSIRAPAGFCGIYGFKPTSSAMTSRDFLQGGFPAALTLDGSAGPLSGSLRDMCFFMRAVLNQKPWHSDPSVVPIPWTGLKTDLGTSPLRVGIMRSDGVITPQPPVSRALDWVNKRLSAVAAIDLKEYEPYKVSDAIAMIRKMYWPDGGASVREALAAGDEPMFLLTKDILKDAESDTPKTAAEIGQMRVCRDTFRSAFTENWVSQEVDVVISPVFFGPAAAHDTSVYWNYTALWNFVDFPAVVFPTPKRACKKCVEDYASADCLGEEDTHVRQLWDEHDYVGAPIGLQITALRHHDNLLFGALALLKDLLDLK